EFPNVCRDAERCAAGASNVPDGGGVPEGGACPHLHRARGRARRRARQWSRAHRLIGRDSQAAESKGFARAVESGMLSSRTCVETRSYAPQAPQTSRTEGGFRKGGPAPTCIGGAPGPEGGRGGGHERTQDSRMRGSSTPYTRSTTRLITM